MSVLSECIDGIQLEVFKIKRNFAKSQEICQDEGGHLVTMENQAKYDRVTEFYASTSFTSNARYWVGLEATDFTVGEKDPLRFFWVDGNPDQSFYEAFGVFPWKDNRPNNLGGQDCVAVRNSAQRFEDLECEKDDVQIFCEYECSPPTSKPTESPTNPPVEEPTPSPTTKTPTPFPTTKVPTPFPTTKEPTTLAPTQAPMTIAPTTTFDPTERVGAGNSLFGIGMPLGMEVGLMVTLCVIACLFALVVRACLCGDVYDYDEEDKEFEKKVKQKADQELAVMQHEL